ncbi:MAG TPA: hypothetical protein PLD82_03420, partial [Spirochaetota bacterium]|nr:hypothetical protein [Spirochaetota bacterium]
ELKKAVENLDKLVAMYDRLSRAEALELAAADDTINAQETVQEATRKELEGVWNTVRAHESAAQLARDELANAYDTIRAHEEVELFASQEVRLLREQLEDEQSADRKRTDHGTE